MGKLFIGKLNINNDIYEVYDKKKDIKKILNSIYKGINANVILNEEDGGRYKFFDIDSKENGVITGKLGHIKAGIDSTYDPNKDTAIDVKNPNKIDYVVFHVNLDDELIAFTTSISIRYKKFFEVFEDLIMKDTKIGVSLKMINDSEKFDEKFKKMEVLKKVKIKFIPPNDDEEDFSKLFSVSPAKFKEANITRATQTLSTRKKDGLKKDSTAIQGYITGTKLGYAEAKFSGKDYTGTDIDIDTAKDTPKYAIVSQNNIHNNHIIAKTANKVFESIKLQFNLQKYHNKNKK